MPRLNFDVSDELNDSLKQLQKKVGLSTMKDLINNALTFYELAVEEIENGSEIASVKDDSYRRITMPSLQHVARTVRVKTPAAMEEVAAGG